MIHSSPLSWCQITQAHCITPSSVHALTFTASPQLSLLPCCNLGLGYGGLFGSLAKIPGSRLVHSVHAYIACLRCLSAFGRVSGGKGSVRSFYRASYASAVYGVIVGLSVCPPVRHKSELYKDG